MKPCWRMANEIDDAICVLYARTCCSIGLNCYKGCPVKIVYISTSSA